MTRLIRSALLAAAGLAWVAVAVTGQEPPQPQKVKVEFRWLESKPIAGVTEDKGIHTSEDGSLSYVHQKPILTNADVVKVELHKTVFNAASDPTEHFTIYFHLTKEARARLAANCGPTGDKMMAALIDGRKWGCPYYLKSRDEATFVPYAGMIPSREEAERVAAAFKN